VSIKTVPIVLEKSRAAESEPKESENIKKYRYIEVKENAKRQNLS